MSAKRVSVVAIVAALVASGAASAGDVPPGGSRSGRNDEHNLWPVPPAEQWRGELLAEQSSPFHFIGEPWNDGDERFANGTFTSRVYRDLGTGGLTFAYLLTQTAHSGINDLERVSISSFALFTTDSYFYDSDQAVRRSADGSTLDYFLNVEDIEGMFLVRTNATTFSPNGTFRLEMDFEPGRARTAPRSRPTRRCRTPPAPQRWSWVPPPCCCAAADDAHPADRRRARRLPRHPRGLYEEGPGGTTDAPVSIVSRRLCR
jgi:hypothetical protein